MTKHILTLILFLTGTLAWSQQYPLFTNYTLNSFGFNPAIAGSMPHWDARLSYRRQWTGIEGAPQTQVASVQGPLRAFGVGGYVFNDAAGKLRRSGISLSGAYGLKLGEVGKLHLGVAGGYYNVMLQPGDSFSGSADPLLSQGSVGLKVPELSAGLYFQMKNGFYLGASVPHLLPQEVRFGGNESPGQTLERHYYGMAGFRKELGDNWALEPSILVKYTERSPIQYDGSLRAIFKEKIWLGGSYRHGAAASAMIGYDINRSLNVAYAYDMSLSDLGLSGGGSHELSLGYRFGHDKDADGDGIADRDDKCPAEPGPVELKGCPKIAPVVEVLADRDKDGIPDIRDKCPQQPGLAEHGGCPPPDRDGDGIADHKDQCPDEPGTLKKMGCPAPDFDADEVADEDDECPKTPGLPENGGCPEATAAELAILELATQNLLFDMGKDVLKKDSYRSLDKLAELLKMRPEYQLRISGHSDSVGNEEFNYNLSKRRSNAVAYYLINRGVGRERLEMEYFGERKPIASNVNENSRKVNRRVELAFFWD